ncbi:MAG: tetratricopeptide repeat protein [Planctomycetaceae bacterium]|nr:tetratricopeptide repeat protein [Planctomycetaceae bacterium]
MKSWMMGILVAAMLVAELCWGAWVLRSARESPMPPPVALSRLPPATANDLTKLQEATRGNRAKDWHALGAAYLAYGYFPEGAACLEHANSLKPNDAIILSDWARCEERFGRLKEANNHYEQAARIDPTALGRNNWYRIGRNQLRMEDAGAAEASFRRALPLITAQHELARLLIQIGRVEEARPLIDELLRSEEIEVRSAMLAARLHRELGDQRGLTIALERAERATGRENLEDYWTYLQPIRERYGLQRQFAEAESLARLNQLPAAAKTIRKLFSETPIDHLDSLFPAAVEVSLRAGNIDEAAALCERFAKRRPPALVELVGVAQIKSHQGDRSAAIEFWQRSMEHLPTPDAARELSQELANRGDREGARVLELESVILQGISAYRRNELESAKQLLDQAREVNPRDPRVEFYLGSIAMALENWNAALRHFERCLELDPHYGLAKERLLGLTE